LGHFKIASKFPSDVICASVRVG